MLSVWYFKIKQNKVYNQTQGIQKGLVIHAIEAFNTVNCVHILQSDDVIISDGRQGSIQLYGRETAFEKISKLKIDKLNLIIIWYWTNNPTIFISLSFQLTKTTSMFLNIVTIFKRLYKKTIGPRPSVHKTINCR